MIVSQLWLIDFRNHASTELRLDSGVTLITGQNGHGKTNLLEAIYFLVNKKSFKKNTSFQQLINVECEEPEILLSSLFQSSDEPDIMFSGKITD